MWKERGDRYNRTIIKHREGVIPICNQDGRPSLRPGTPGGSEEMTQAYSEVRRDTRKRVPGRSDNEGIRLMANRYNTPMMNLVVFQDQVERARSGSEDMQEE